MDNIIQKQWGEDVWDWLCTSWWESSCCVEEMEKDEWEFRFSFSVEDNSNHSNSIVDKTVTGRLLVTYIDGKEQYSYGIEIRDGNISGTEIQHMELIEHYLEEGMSRKEVKNTSKPKNHGKPWSEGHLNFIQICFDWRTIHDIADTLGRDYAAIVWKLKEVGRVDFHIPEGKSEEVFNDFVNKQYGNVRIEDLQYNINLSSFKPQKKVDNDSHDVIIHKLTIPEHDLSSKISDDFTIKHVKTGEWKIEEDLNLNKTQEKQTMNRRTVTIELWDMDKAVEVDVALVASFDVVTEDDDQTTIQEVIMNEDIAGTLEEYNSNRVKMTNKDILNRTGQKVMLEPIRLKNLEWKVKE